MRKSKPFKPYLGARHHSSTDSKYGLHLDGEIGLEARSNGQESYLQLDVLGDAEKLERRILTLSRTSQKVSSDIEGFHAGGMWGN